MFDKIKEILILEKKFRKTNHERLKKEWVYIRNNLIDSDGKCAFDS